MNCYVHFATITNKKGATGNTRLVRQPLNQQTYILEAASNPSPLLPNSRNSGSEKRWAVRLRDRKLYRRYAARMSLQLRDVSYSSNQRAQGRTNCNASLSFCPSLPYFLLASFKTREPMRAGAGAVRVLSRGRGL